MKQTKRLYPKPVTNPKPGRWRAFRESSRGRKGIAGSSLVEFAVVVPVLLTLVMAMFVFGIAMNQYLTLTNATTSGAQALATARGQTATRATPQSWRSKQHPRPSRRAVSNSISRLMAGL